MPYDRIGFLKLVLRTNDNDLLPNIPLILRNSVLSCAILHLTSVRVRVKVWVGVGVRVRFCVRVRVRGGVRVRARVIS
jgi:hypothetical protein